MKFSLKEVPDVTRCSLCGQTYNRGAHLQSYISAYGHEWAHPELYYQSSAAKPQFRRPLYWQFIHVGGTGDW